MTTVIERFYARLMEDDLLAKFFVHIEDFSTHQQRITDFWWQALGGQLEQPLRIDMIGKHITLGIQDEHLQRWLEVFRDTLASELEEPLAAQWMDRAIQVGARLKQIVIDHQSPIPVMTSKP